VLVEVSGIRQPDAPFVRRWFEDEWCDLIVWMSPDGSVDGFQLCYDKPGIEHAVTWRRSTGAAHHRVDTGEPSPKHNLTPILLDDGAFPAGRVIGEFTARSGRIEEPVRSLVLERLRIFARGIPAGEPFP